MLAGKPPQYVTPRETQPGHRSLGRPTCNEYQQKLVRVNTHIMRCTGHYLWYCSMSWYSAKSHRTGDQWCSCGSVKVTFSLCVPTWAPTGMGKRGHLPPSGNVVKCVCALVVIAKCSIDQLFIHYFYKSASGGSAPKLPLGLHPSTLLEDFRPRPLICRPLEKNPAGSRVWQMNFDKWSDLSDLICSTYTMLTSCHICRILFLLPCTWPGSHYTTQLMFIKI